MEVQLQMRGFSEARAPQPLPAPSRKLFLRAGVQRPLLPGSVAQLGEINIPGNFRSCFFSWTQPLIRD